MSSGHAILRSGIGLQPAVPVVALVELELLLARCQAGSA